MRLATEEEHRAQLADDVRRGLTRSPKTLPPKYLYDAYGSELFEQITELPEYYLTRAETEILERIADDLVDSLRPSALAEVGSGSSRKTRLLLEALGRHGSGQIYAPLDVSESAVRAAASALVADYPWLRVQGIVGDFDRHLGALPPAGGRRLIALLGSTIGNLEPAEQTAFLAEIAAHLGPDEALLLGADLVKDPQVLEAAYDDAAGVTAAFNRNVLSVVNRELDGDLPLEAFEHVARYRPAEQRVEMWLRARRPVVAWLAGLGLRVSFAEGEKLRTEISCKFTLAGLAERLAAAGLELVRAETDAAQRFVLAVARPQR